ncbi:MAG: hypothetical protein QXF52_00855 [Thermoproteota archaeon]|nr:hypothetical protein [Candidatus Brockarchaeota archaeon]
MSTTRSKNGIWNNARLLNIAGTAKNMKSEFLEEAFLILLPINVVKACTVKRRTRY